MIARCLHEVLPDCHPALAPLKHYQIYAAAQEPAAGKAAKSSTRKQAAQPQQDPPKPCYLDLLATRIGRTREVMGLHFPSDTDAEINAAKQAYERVMDPLMTGGDGVLKYLKRAAVEEWEKDSSPLLP